MLHTLQIKDKASKSSHISDDNHHRWYERVIAKCLAYFKAIKIKKSLKQANKIDSSKTRPKNLETFLNEL